MAACFVWFIGQARAEVLVSASFSSGGEERLSLVGLSDDQPAQTPDGVNVSGEIWRLSGGGAVDVMMWENAARVRNGGAVAVSLGGRNVDALLTVSIEITFEIPESKDWSNPPSEQEMLKLKGDFKNGKAILGFYSEVPAQKYGDRYKAFTGLQARSDGSLQLYVNGGPVGQPILYGGTFAPELPILLSFTVNTTTGALTQVAFGSSTATYSFPTTAFTKEATALAGFGGSLGNGLLYINFREFAVASIPAESL